MQLTTLLDARWPALLAGLPESLDLKQTAREHGAFVRARKVRSPEDLLRLGLVYGLGKLSLRSTALWAACTGVADLKDESLLERLCKAAPWFEHIVQALLAAQMPLPEARWRGYRLRMRDATTVSKPGSTGTDWRLHVAYDLQAAAMTAIGLTDEHGAESLDRFPVGPGDVVICDRGYARAADLDRLRQTGADVIVRLGWRSLRLQTPEGTAFDLMAALRAAPADEAVAQDVVVVDPRSQRRRVPLRLIIKRKTAEATERCREQFRKQKSRKGGQLDPRSLEAAEFIFVLTSLPADQFSAEAVLSLYRLRWQIELLFKRLKSLIGISALPTQDPALSRTWIFANLIGALLVETLTRQVRDSFPCGPRSGGPGRAAGRAEPVAALSSRLHDGADRRSRPDSRPTAGSGPEAAVPLLLRAAPQTPETSQGDPAAAILAPMGR